MNRLAYIAPVRLTEIVQYIVDQRELPGKRLWWDRLPLVPVNSNDLKARFINRVRIADQIPLNARAKVYKGGHLRVESTEIAKIKYGTAWDEEEIKDLEAWSAQNSGVPGATMLTNFLVDNGENLAQGVFDRINYMSTGMALDSYTYHDENGIQMAGVTFGMPSDLKVLVSVYWTDHTNSVPFTDILNFLYRIEIQYGVRYNRITMSQPLFREIIANDNYEDLAKPYLPFYLSPQTNIPATDIEFHRNLVGRILGLEIEFDDTRYWKQWANGSESSFRNMPINRVIFSMREWDNTRRLGDVGNAIVNESLIAEYTNGNVLGGPLPQRARGPISYVTGEIDPPGLQQWIVMNCWPRKGELYSTATMKAASDTFTDGISFISPF